MLPRQIFIQKVAKKFDILSLCHMLLTKLYRNVLVERFLWLMKKDKVGFSTFKASSLASSPFLTCLSSEFTIFWSLRASSGLQLINVCFVVLSLKLFQSVEMVFKTSLYFRLG